MNKSLENTYGQRPSRNIVSPVLTGVFRLAPLRDSQKLPGNATRIIDRHGSMYLLPTDETGNKHILIDAGMRKDAGSLRRFLGTQGLGSIEAVFVTHAHADHVGALHALKDYDVPAFISEKDSRVLRGQARSEGLLPGLAEKLLKIRAEVPGLVPEIMEEDEVQKFGNLTIRAIGLPGHTTGSLGYLIEDGSDSPANLFVGDALDFKRHGKTVNAAKPFTHDSRQSAETIGYLAERLAGFDIGVVVPSHSGHSTFEAVQAFRAS